MPCLHLRRLLSPALVAAALAVPCAAAPRLAQGTPGPGPVPVDAFHPDLQPGQDGPRSARPVPALGGSATLQLISPPRRLAGALDGSGATSRVLEAVHETLMRTDPETWDSVPGVARRQVVEDQLVLGSDALERYPQARRIARLLPGSRTEREQVGLLYGELSEAGDGWRLTPRSPGSALDGPLEVPAADVREVVRGGVVTFELRDDVRWQPWGELAGQRLDARDVLFSFSIYANPQIECGERRYQYEKVAAAEAVDALTVRFFLGRRDVWAVADLGALFLFPSHLYDLSDPDNPDHDPEADPARQASYVNENPRNTLWVGLGPWRVTSFEGDVVEAERFEGYFDPARAGYLDRLRWRRFPDDAAALQALLAGELDFFDRLATGDYFGELTRGAPFTERCYKAWSTRGVFSYVCWNTHRPGLDDARVRRALGHCLDVERDVLGGYYKGLGNVVTGPFPFHSPAYDHSVQPLGLDLEEAARLLAEAGWYDRDGDGWVDRDGARLSLEFAAISGNPFTPYVAQLLQEGLREVGVELTVREYEWGTFREKVHARELDAFSQGWLPPLEPDPEQMWHSRWGQPDVRSANYSGLRDEQVDALIELGQGQLDDEQRWATWRALHRRLAELQPFLFLVNPATKVAVDRRLHGVQLFHVEPGFDVRRWYRAAGSPGTRPADGVGHWAGGEGR